MDRIRFNRRDLVRFSLIGGTGTLLLAGSAPRRTSARATPTSRGETIPELRVGVAQLPISMDPQENSGIASSRVQYVTYDTLIRLDYLNNNELVPALATEWERVDELTLDVTLRDDVVWHDGAPFTAADVEYTFGRILGDDPGLGANPTLFPFASVEALDDRRVRFGSRQVDPVLERRLTDSYASIVPADYHRRVGPDAFRRAPIGTGPYRLTEFVPDSHCALAANERYFGGVPAAERVTIRLIPEVATRIAALRNGEVDLITDVPPDQVPNLESESDLIVKTAPLASIYVLQFNMRLAPLDRREVRQALSLAIDRRALVDALWGGRAVHTRGMQFEGEELHNPERPLTPYDPERARALLAEGGYAGEEISYHIFAPDYYITERQTAEAIVGMWREVGISARIETDEPPRRLEELAKRDSRYNVGTNSIGNRIGDPDSYLFGSTWGPDGQAQPNWWPPASAARYNELGERARRTLDQAERFQLYQRMLDELEREAPGTILYQPSGIFAMADRVDWTPYSWYYLDLRPSNFKIR